MVDYVDTDGTFQEIQSVVCNFLVNNQTLQNHQTILVNSNPSVFTDDAINNLHETISSQVILDSIKEDAYSIHEDERDYQLPMGEMPYSVHISKILLTTIDAFALDFFSILEKNIPFIRKIQIIKRAVGILLAKGLVTQIPPQHYCVYMFAQKCANEGNGIFTISDLCNLFEESATCRGWPVYPINNQYCNHFNEPSCQLYNNSSTRLTVINSAIAFFREKEVIIPVSDNSFRFSF